VLVGAVVDQIARMSELARDLDDGVALGYGGGTGANRSGVRTPYPRNAAASGAAGRTGRQWASRAAADCVPQTGSLMISRALVVSAWWR
jgi:hypothetical protein